MPETPIISFFSKQKQKTMTEKADNITRIYNLINQRRDMTPDDWGLMFGIEDFDNHPSKWAMVKIAINVLDKIGSDYDLFMTCENCGYHNPLDTDRSEWTDKQVEEDNHPCEGCGVELFDNLPF